MENKVKTWMERIPEFCLSHWLLRIPLAVVFIQQGIAKIPVTVEESNPPDNKITAFISKFNLNFMSNQF